MNEIFGRLLKSTLNLVLFPTFHAWLESRGTLRTPSNMDTVEIPRRRKISDVAKSYVHL